VRSEKTGGDQRNEKKKKGVKIYKKHFYLLTGVKKRGRKYFP